MLEYEDDRKREEKREGMKEAVEEGKEMDKGGNVRKNCVISCLWKIHKIGKRKLQYHPGWQAQSLPDKYRHTEGRSGKP